MEALSDGKRLRVPLHWQDLLPGIKWDNVLSASSPRCSVKLLQLLAAFGSAANSRRVSSRSKMIGLMVSALDPEGTYLTYRCAGHRWTLESTPECLAKYSVHIRVALAGARGRISRWDLGDWDDDMI